MAEESEPLVVRKPSDASGQRRGCRVLVLVLTFFAALGGFVLGYNTSVVSGAMLKVKESFQLTPIWQELIVSVTIMTACLASILSGVLCDLFGRKLILTVSAMISVLGAGIMAGSVHAWMLLLGRGVVGVGVGLIAMAAPMYIAESAPAHKRGKLVVVEVVFIGMGQFFSTIMDGAFSYIDSSVGWRLMLGLSGVPAVVMFVGFLFMPESPRWFVFRGRTEQAKEVLRKIRHPEEVVSELQNIVRDHQEQKKSTICVCGSKAVMMALFVGCGLQLFQQFSGVNAALYYGASIMQMAGFSDRYAIWLASVMTGTNLLFTLVGLLLIDRIGRRKLLIGSLVGVVLSLLLLSATFVAMDWTSPPSRPYDASCPYWQCGRCVGTSGCGYCVQTVEGTSDYFNGTCSPLVQVKNGSFVSKYFVDGVGCALYGENATNESTAGLWMTTAGSGSGGSGIGPLQQREFFAFDCPGNKFAPLAITSLILFIAFYAPGLGPLPWVVNAEIYPTWARSVAISVATLFNWGFNLLISMTFLTTADAIGQPATFGSFVAFSFVGLVFVLLFLPETKGRTLEEVESLFQRPYFTTCFSRKRKGYSSI